MVLQKLVALCLFAAIFSAAADVPVLDTNGDRIVSGAQYYIKPAIVGRGGALTLVARKNGKPCPKYVGQVEHPDQKGTPVKFMLAPVTNEGWLAHITFQTSDSCSKLTMWGLGDRENVSGRRLITSGSELLVEVLFKIVKSNGLYHILWCTSEDHNPQCGSAGILSEDGVSLLALDGPELPFVFEKVK
ncbi:alpha-amylase/subtilisin inhibitor-like [Momordica charantia]|uniref:Alpha-amylase/subtilisin inhibitor-like n=1 Tax=Momordica charantia TaxID=3673 RepID=A0A6J1DBL5_MOMCH|nr:alpha-amylase/subtilisin inhibitor-like [Momordica charantia]